MSKKTLYISISDHGYGHIGQMAPILNKLAMEHGREIAFVIQCAAKPAFLAEVFHFDFRHIAKAADIGMLMGNSLDVRTQQSHRAYRELHDRWPKELLLKSREIARVRPDLVVSNVSYLTLAAAHHLGLPAIALCSLNWADIYWHYCNTLPGAEDIYALAQQHYASAEHFLIPTPAMPMTDLPNRRPIGPLARLANYYPNFRQALKLTPEKRLIMVSMGGIHYDPGCQHWPTLKDVVWIDTSNSCIDRKDVIPMNRCKLRFIDLMAQCHLLICKPGYGLVSEATCNGVPMLYIKRGDWPEEPYLLDWLQENNLCVELSREQFHQGNFATQVLDILDATPISGTEASPDAMVAAHLGAQHARPNSVVPRGVGEACGYILEGLGLV